MTSRLSLKSNLKTLAWILISLPVFVACTRKGSAPSVVIVAVDHLGVNELNCNREAKTVRHSGIDLLCEESVRFTHAFTTSNESLPALTSVLTGLYPYESHVRTNKDALSNTIETLPEWLQKKKYQTFFASGGAPVFRKSGLHQGFDIFDDNIVLQAQQLFRPFSKSQEVFFSTVKDLNSLPVFSLFYVPDLAFANTVTRNELGETRNLSFESQLETFDENLYSFFQQLKKRTNWDSTVIILVGLFGPGTPDGREPPRLSLLQDRVQVGLLIKPSRKPRDRGIRWTIDKNVTLADLAPTLKDWISGEEPPNETEEPFPRISFAQGLSKAVAPWDSNRLILLETPWEDEWRLSTRKEQWTFIFDEKPKIYNSLIDHMETTAASVAETGSSELVQESIKRLGAISAKPFSGGKYSDKLKVTTLAQIYSLNRPTKDRTVDLKQLWLGNKSDIEIYNLLVGELLVRQNWHELKAIATIAKDQDLIELAQISLGEKKEETASFKGACMKLFTQRNLPSTERKLCGNNLVYDLYDFFTLENANEDSGDRDNARKKFLKSYGTYLLDKKIYETDLALGEAWDLNRIQNPEIEKVLALKSIQKLRPVLFR